MVTKRWSKKEDKLLIRQVKNHAANLQDAFRITAKKTKRSCTAVQAHWYYVLLKKPETGICLATIGYKTKNVNRKNVHVHTSDNTVKTEISWWRKVLSLLKIIK